MTISNPILLFLAFVYVGHKIAEFYWDFKGQTKTKPESIESVVGANNANR